MLFLERLYIFTYIETLHPIAFTLWNLLQIGTCEKRMPDCGDEANVVLAPCILDAANVGNLDHENRTTLVDSVTESDYHFSFFSKVMYNANFPLLVIRPLLIIININIKNELLISFSMLTLTWKALIPLLMLRGSILKIPQCFQQRITACTRFYIRKYGATYLNF